MQIALIVCVVLAASLQFIVSAHPPHHQSLGGLSALHHHSHSGLSGDLDESAPFHTEGDDDDDDDDNRRANEDGNGEVRRVWLIVIRRPTYLNDTLSDSEDSFNMTDGGKRNGAGSLPYFARINNAISHLMTLTSNDSNSNMSELASNDSFVDSLQNDSMVLRPKRTLENFGSIFMPTQSSTPFPIPILATGSSVAFKAAMTKGSILREETPAMNVSTHPEQHETVGSQGQENDTLVNELLNSTRLVQSSPSMVGMNRTKRTLSGLWPALMLPSLSMSNMPDESTYEHSGLNNATASNHTLFGNGTATGLNGSLGQEHQANSSSASNMLPLDRSKRDIAYVPTASGHYKPMIMIRTPYGPMLMPIMKSPTDEPSPPKSFNSYSRYSDDKPSYMSYKSMSKQPKSTYNKYSRFEDK